MGVGVGGEALHSSFHSAARPGLIKEAVQCMLGVFSSVSVFTCVGLRAGGRGGWFDRRRAISHLCLICSPSFFLNERVSGLRL